MNERVTIEFIDHYFPVNEPEIRKMTRKEKLAHWANIVRYSHRQLLLFSNLEYMSPHHLEHIKVYQLGPSAMVLAVTDPEFQKDGLSPTANIPELMRYFDLSLQQLHEFSCDCGGFIDNHEQARRIERLA